MWLYSGNVVVIGQCGCNRQNWFYSNKVVVFGKKWGFSGNVVLLGQKCFYWGKSSFSQTRWLFSVIVFLFGKNGCIGTKVVVFG